MKGLMKTTDLFNVFNVLCLFVTQTRLTLCILRQLLWGGLPQINEGQNLYVLSIKSCIYVESIGAFKYVFFVVAIHWCWSTSEASRHFLTGERGRLKIAQVFHQFTSGTVKCICAVNFICFMQTRVFFLFF